MLLFKYLLAIQSEDCQEKSMEENEQSEVAKRFKKGCFFETISLFEVQTVSFLDARLVTLSASLPGMRRNGPLIYPRAVGSKGKSGLAISSLRSYLLKWISVIQ